MSTDDFQKWEAECLADRARIFREYRKAYSWSRRTAAAVFCVSPQTISRWEKTGRYDDVTYRQIFESDWGQAKFNPGWPNSFARCAVGYSDAERVAIWMAEVKPMGAA